MVSSLVHVLHTFNPYPTAFPPGNSTVAYGCNE